MESVMSATLKRGVKVYGRLWIKLIHVDELHKDAAYQRAPSQGNLENIGGDTFNLLALGALLVGKRKQTGLNNVIDGQHRLEVIRRKLENGELTDSYVLCQVIENTTQKEEADLFVLLNTNKPVTGNMRFRARLLCGHNPESFVNEIVMGHGFQLLFLPPSKPRADMLKPNGLRGEGVMLKAYKAYGHDKFKMAIEILKKCYSEQHHARQGSFIYGICHFLSTQTIDRTTLGTVINRLQGTEAKVAIELAEEMLYSSGKYRRIGQWMADTCGLRRAA
jgi:hypothetical protein